MPSVDGRQELHSPQTVTAEMFCRKAIGGGGYFFRVNWLRSMYPARNASAQPVRYRMYRW